MAGLVYCTKSESQKGQVDASLARLCARHVSLCEVYLHHPLPHASFGVWFVLFHQQKIENDMDNIEYALRVVDEEVGCFVQVPCAASQ